MSGYHMNNGVGVPDESAIFAQFKSMDKASLQKLMDSDEDINKLILESVQIKSIKDEKQNVTASNIRVANANIQLEPRLSESRQRLIEMHNKIQDARNNYNSLKARIDSMSDKHSLTSVQDLLEAAIIEAEEVTETNANDLLSGSIDVDKFLTDFLPNRKLWNERRVKSEKLAELVSRQQAPIPPPSYNPPNSSVPTPAYPFPGSGYGFNTPRPPPSVGMPQPHGAYGYPYGGFH